jgi:FkbM family methyltransferase
MLATILHRIIRKIPFYTEIKRRKFYRNLIHSTNLCFDIGANIGTKSKTMIAIGAKVIAFEPQSSCHEQLSKIKNSNFNFYPFAVGAKNEEKELHLSSYSEIATLSKQFIDNYSSEKVFWINTEKVQVKSIDYLIDQFGLPDYCKIDVEGYELEIVHNLSHQIPMIELEFTEKFLSDTLQIIEKLGSNYEYNFNLNEQLKFQLKNWVKKNEIKSILTQLPKDKLHGNLFCKIIH